MVQIVANDAVLRTSALDHGSCTLGTGLLAERKHAIGGLGQPLLEHVTSGRIMSCAAVSELKFVAMEAEVLSTRA